MTLIVSVRTAPAWVEIIERYRRSGMTAAAFAAQEGIGAKRLHNRGGGSVEVALRRY